MKQTKISRAPFERGVSPLAGAPARATRLSELLTPPSNTGVNDGGSSKGLGVTGVNGYKPLTSRAKVAKVVPKCDLGVARPYSRDDLGQFEGVTPLNDARLFAEVIALRAALERVEPFLLAIAEVDMSPPGRNVFAGAGQVLRAIRLELVRHTDISNEPLPAKRWRKA